MTELSDLGHVHSADVLIIGGGLGGMVTGLKIKRMDPKIDVLVVEKDYHGYTGQSTKAGHGVYHMAPDDDIDAFCKEQVETNNFGLYLNDQDYMYETTRDAYSYLDELADLGAVFAHNDDGSFHYHREFADKKCSSSNVDLNFVVPLAQMALKAGVRVMERTYFTDLLTEGERVVGALGFNIDTCEFDIFRAKAVCLAANSFNPAVTGMFYTSATALIAAYEAGAQLRNPEQATYCDLGFRNTKNFMYGVHWVIHNKNGENLFMKYGSRDLENIDLPLMLGMAKEVQEGNAPLFVDFSKLPETSATEGEGFNMGMVMPTRVSIDEFIHGQMAEGGTEEVLAMPEISLTMYVFSECLRVDIDAKTTVDNLWAVGTIGMYGASHGSWVHGDGVGYAGRTGLRAAKSIVAALDDIEQGEVSIDQVQTFKKRIYAPLGYTGAELPYRTIHYLDRLICKPENSIMKTEQSIRAVLDEVGEIRTNLGKTMRVPEGDGHHLFKAVEARTMLDMLEIMFMAYDARKESRGFHMRADYPERDDRHWLNWIVVNKGDDGRPDLSFERIPFERYKWKPEGWTPEWEIE